MSLESIRSILQNLSQCSVWSLQLLNIKTSKKNGTGYSSRQITLSPSDRLNGLLTDITNIYISNGKKSIDLYREVRQYDGTTDAGVIYKLSIEDELIKTEYERFLQTIANPDTENSPFEYHSAYLLKGQISINGEDVPVKLVSMQNPITTLKHKFSLDNSTFKEVRDPLLSLRPTMDIIIISDKVYFLTLAGENLFNMARSYKAVCEQKVDEIVALDIIDSIDTFKSAATSGHNPRKFVSYDKKKLEALKRKGTRVSISKQFGISLNSSGDKFDASVDGVSEKIVKFLCNKGMIDPIEKGAVEVDGARKWN